MNVANWRPPWVMKSSGAKRPVESKSLKVHIMEPRRMLEEDGPLGDASRKKVANDRHDVVTTIILLCLGLLICVAIGRYI